MATTKSKSTTQKLKEAKARIAELEQAVVVQNNLLSPEEVESNYVYKATVEQEYVPKEVLADETLLERLNWWFKDLSPKHRLIAQAVFFIIVLGAVTGVYFASNEATDGTGISEYISTVLALIGLFTGVNLQFKSLRMPAKFNASHLEDV